MVKTHRSVIGETVHVSEIFFYRPFQDLRLSSSPLIHPAAPFAKHPPPHRPPSRRRLLTCAAPPPSRRSSAGTPPSASFSSAFRRRFRDLHLHPTPMLGFLCNEVPRTDDACSARFVHTAAWSPPIAAGRGWHALDARAGRVLLQRDPASMSRTCSPAATAATTTCPPRAAAAHAEHESRAALRGRLGRALPRRPRGHGRRGDLPCAARPIARLPRVTCPRVASCAAATDGLP